MYVCVGQVEETEESENDKCYCTAASMATEEKDSDIEALCSVYLFSHAHTNTPPLSPRPYTHTEKCICMQGRHLTALPNSS